MYLQSNITLTNRSNADRHCTKLTLHRRLSKSHVRRRFYNYDSEFVYFQTTSLKTEC